MAFRSARKHRFPLKRNSRKLLLLPLLLILLLIGAVSGLLIVNQDEGASMSDTPLHLVKLDRQEAYPAGPLPPAPAFDKLLVEKSKRRLTAFSKDKPVRVYLVALGHNPAGPKEIQGDKRTPEGFYRIDDKNAASAYYKNLGISYPNEADLARAKALNAPPGGDIKIHGLAAEFADMGPAHRLTDWTYGCIAVTNEEMEEIFTHTPVGVPIEIRP